MAEPGGKLEGRGAFGEVPPEVGSREEKAEGSWRNKKRISA